MSVSLSPLHNRRGLQETLQRYKDLGSYLVKLCLIRQVVGVTKFAFRHTYYFAKDKAAWGD